MAFYGGDGIPVMGPVCLMMMDGWGKDLCCMAWHGRLFAGRARFVVYQ